MHLDSETINLIIKIAIGFEVFTALIGILFFYKIKHTKVLKYFVLSISYVAVNELIGLYIKLNEGINAIIHNVYNVITFSFFLILYRSYLKNPKRKKTVLIFIILYLTTFVINGFFENYLENHQRIPYIIGALFLVITISFYFIEILNSEKVLNAKRNILVWISVGLLIYYVGNIPFRILRNYYVELTDASALFLVNITLTIIKNVCFIIGFIWSEKKQPY